MSKKHFIALADLIRATTATGIREWDTWQIHALANWCQDQNPNFNRERWFAYIAGKCGPNGGKVKNLQPQT